MSGNLRTELTREEVNKVLVEGFLPKVPVSDRPVSRTRTGLRTAGLPYARFRHHSPFSGFLATAKRH